MTFPSTIPHFYAGVPPEKVEQVTRFRQQQTLYHAEIEQRTWDYYACGGGDDTVLVMPGGGGDAEALFRYIAGFAEAFRVIAPNLPANLNSLEDVMAGLRGILAAERISRVHVFGLSFGGALAQIFMRRLPHLVDDVVLTHTALPDAQMAAQVRMQQAFFRLYPAPVLRWLMRRSMQRAIDAAPFRVEAGERQFWKAYYHELYTTRFGRSDWLARARLSAAYYGGSPFQSTDLDKWKGRVLIIESEFDEVLDEGLRGALKATYPGAYVQTLSGYSHLAGVLASEVIMTSARKFLLS